MSTVHAVRTEHAPPPRETYSQAVVVGDLVFTAGTTPHHPGTRSLVGEDVATQTRQVLDNLAAILEAAGSGLEHVVKVTVHLADLKGDFFAFDEAYAEVFDALPVAARPARTTVGSALYDILVEIDVVARVVSS